LPLHINYMRAIYQHVINYARKINWVLLVFLLLVLNVKLIVKVAAIVLVAIFQYKDISIRKIVQQRSLYFYFAVIGIGVINFLLQSGYGSTNQILATTLGLGIWIMAAAACFFIYQLVQKEEPARLHHTIQTFFLLHIAATFLRLLLIIVETGTINPYVYTGMHQKYYINTGDYIMGITFDSPVTTGVISAFAVFYFLYRQRYALSLASMLSLLIVGSNLTNLFVAAVLLFVFVFHSGRVRKSLVIVQLCLLIIFIARISPQNNEHTGRMLYKIMGKPFDIAKKNTSINFIKQQPDSLLNDDERRKKFAQLYMDSISMAKLVQAGFTPEQVQQVKIVHDKIIPVEAVMPVDSFHIYKEAESVTGKITRYGSFIEEEYSVAERDTMIASFSADRAGKWIAFVQLVSFLKKHPSKWLMGAGIGNFSSRTAFKVTGLNIAGTYPVKYRYIHPAFRDNHLFLYVYFYSKSEDKHSTTNTPDSTYFQLLGEYGLLGVLAFVALYAGYFLLRLRRLTFGLPVLLLLLGLFSAEYWFEQLSIVVLAEALLFIDLRSQERREEPVI
jgi:hypothetical protein